MVDHRLAADKITFRGGSHTQTITMDHEDYVALAGADVVDIAAGV